MLAILALFEEFGRAFMSTIREPGTQALAIVTGLLLAIGTGFYSLVEGWGILDSLYFSVISLATIGYGDFVPTTDAGKIFTIVYVLSGIGVIVSFVSTVASHAVNRRLAIHDRKAGLSVPPMDPADDPGADTSASA
jgi:hypothetical protein